MRLPSHSKNDIKIKISDNDDFLEEWDEKYSPAYKREVVVVK